MNKTMKAIVTTGNGGYDKLVYKDVPIPDIGDSQVLVRVLAAGMNNTEINTRLGWYSSSVSGSTNDASESDVIQAPKDNDGGWNKATPFPFIQGTDCCGIVEKVANKADRSLIGRRIIVRSCMRKQGFNSLENIWMGSDFNGAFAQYVAIDASEAFAVDCDWSDAELATIPCSYGTSENMLHRAGLKANETVLVLGASGGVGSAVLQLAKRRGARVIAIASQEKHQQVVQLGADKVFDRNADLLELLGEKSIDVVVDNVGGESFATMLKLLVQGGRLVSSGAIAGPLVNFDLRDMYLKDIKLIGTTAWDEPVFPNLIKYIEDGELQPVLAKTFPLSSIVEAQKEFLLKKHVGNFVLML